MKQLFATLLLAGAASALNAQSTPLPYTSNMYASISVLDDGWTSYTARKTKGFEYDRDNTVEAGMLATPNTSCATCHPYDSSNDANCWLYSPAFDLKAGGNYTIGIWAKTKGGDAESFKICYGTEASSSSMTTTVLDKPGFLSPDDYTYVTGTVSPESDMTVHFGVHCYSPANSYVLSLTGFTVSDENGSTDIPDVPTPPVEAVELPYEYDFTSASDFSKNWTTVNGPDAALSGKWTINEHSGWAVFDIADGKKEDNWMISNPIKFTEAGNYAIVHKGMVNGKLEFLLGTDPADLSSFSHVAELEVGESLDNDAEYVLPFELAQGGEYRLAVRACAETGTFMGYRVKSIKVRSDKPTPATVKDLRATADGNDALSVKLTWTNPSTDNTGKELAELTKLELYRNGELIKDDFTNLTTNAENTWTDEPAEAGVYTYHIVAYNSNGCTDAEAVKANAGYVGRPTAGLPYSAAPSSAETMAMMTASDANGDGKTWQFVQGDYSWENALKIELELDEAFDDYIMSPYIHLTPGYYTFGYSANCRYNSIEAGYATDRHNPAASFVKVSEVINHQDWGAYSENTVIAIKEEGDYVFGLHATGTCTNASYPSIALSSLSLKASQKLPKGATELKAMDAPAAEGFDVTLTWKNPTLDNAGLPLDADEALTISIYRDGSNVATLSGEGYVPGASCTWTDKGVEADSDHTYSVNVANANGTSDDTKPEVSIHVGPVMSLPYETSDFSEWTAETGTYPWTIDPESKYAVWDGVESWYPSYTIYTPYIRLEEGKEYDLEAVFDYNTGDTQDIKFVSKPNADSYDLTNLGTFQLPKGATDYKVQFSVSAGEISALAEEAAGEAERMTMPAEKFMMGIRVTESGKITLKHFSLKEHATVGITGVGNEAGEALYSDGVVSYPAATAITVVDLAGRVLLSTHAATLDVRSLRGAGVVIVSAPGYRALKLVL